MSNEIKSKKMIYLNYSSLQIRLTTLKKKMTMRSKLRLKKLTTNLTPNPLGLRIQTRSKIK